MKTLTLTGPRPKIALQTPPAGLVPARRPPGMAMPLVLRPRPVVPRAPLRPLPPKRTYGASRGDGYVSRLFGTYNGSADLIEIELPPGTPRHVNVATFKRLLGAKRNDRILKRGPAAWAICEETAIIDLLDTKSEYRVGQIAVAS